LREVRLEHDHTLEAFYRLTRLVHRQKGHAAAKPALVRTGGDGQRSVEICERLDVAAQPAENDAEQIERVDMLRLTAQDGFAQPLGIAELAGLERRHRLGKLAVVGRSG